MLARIVCSLLLAPLFVCGQFSEDFRFESINDLPAWKGTDSAWTLKDGVLQSASTRANTAFYLSRPFAAPPAARWEWWTKLDFNTSSSNYADVFLSADSADLTQASGYFVRIGNTQDEVSLYFKPPKGTAIKMIDGRDGITNLSSNTLEIKVTRSEAGEWQLYTRPPSGAYVSEGKVAAAAPAGTHFGILVRQSTASFFGQHYFDNVFCGGFNRDTAAPTVAQLEVRDRQHIFVLFSEIPDSLYINNFAAANNVGHPDKLEKDPVVPAAYLLYYEQPFPSGQHFNFTITGVKDEEDNIMTDYDTVLVYYQPVRYDVVVSEIFTDPLPAVGLPTYEYVELHNRTSYNIKLAGWKFAANSNAVTLPRYDLPAGGRVIICGTTAGSLYSSWGPTLAVSSFPSLANEQDQLVLYNEHGSMMHTVAYTKAWYGNTLKEEGGWSLEMISADNACSGKQNWKASLASAGGSPGKPNSVAGNIIDEAPAGIIQVTAIDSTHVRLYFNSALDSLSAGQPAHYTIQPGNAHPEQVVVETPLLQTVIVQLPAAMRNGQLYELRIKDIKRCNGISEGLDNAMSFGLPQPPAAGDVVISEVLFNPPPGVADFVELYNRSAKVIDLSGLYLANRKTDGNLDNIVKLSADGRQLLPGRYMAFTTQKEALCRAYACKAVNNVLEQVVFPSYPDDLGTVVLLDAQGGGLEEFAYTAKQHFPLISNPDGVSLERLDMNGPASWHSASSVAGYATPGYANSQQAGINVKPGSLTVHPDVFSPDNDGRDDLAFISYTFTGPGKVANITVFDAVGLPVRSLARSQLLGNTGKLSWDGLTDDKQPLKPGVYVVWAEVFDPAGQVNRWKIPLVLAKSFAQ